MSESGAVGPQVSFFYEIIKAVFYTKPLKIGLCFISVWDQSLDHVHSPTHWRATQTCLCSCLSMRRSHVNTTWPVLMIGQRERNMCRSNKANRVFSCSSCSTHSGSYGILTVGPVTQAHPSEIVI